MQIIQSNPAMHFSYGLFEFDMPSDWISQLDKTYSTDRHYQSYQEYADKLVRTIPITQINHKIRNPGTPIFHDKEGMTARERTVRILCGFENREKIIPVFVRRISRDENVNLFNMIDGCHRLHASIAYGFKFIPAIIFGPDELTPVIEV